LKEMKRLDATDETTSPLLGNGEPVQPVKDKKDFLKLTGVRYVGP